MRHLLQNGKSRHTGSGARVVVVGVTVAIVIIIIAVKEASLMNSVLSLMDIFIQVISWRAPK